MYETELFMSNKKLLAQIREKTRTNPLRSKTGLMYGLRLMACVRLRAKDVDFKHNSIIFRSRKGDHKTVK